MPYIANNNFKQLYKWCFTLWFDSLIYKMGKRKKEDHTFLRKKKQRKTKYCYHNGICRWKRDSFSNEIGITRGMV